MFTSNTAFSPDLSTIKRDILTIMPPGCFFLDEYPPAQNLGKDFIGARGMCLYEMQSMCSYGR